jgi:hypothetical protein
VAKPSRNHPGLLGVYDGEGIPVALVIPNSSNLNAFQPIGTIGLDGYPKIRPFSWGK